MRLGLLALGLMVATLPGCGRATQSGSLPLRLVRDVPLAGDTSRFDYQDIDVERRRLYVAHLGASRIDVVDLDGPSVIHTITDISMVHGVRVASVLGRLYASATGTNEIVTIDEQTFAEVARTPAGDYPDGLALDAGHDRVFVSNERGGTETVIDAHSGAPIGTVALGGEAGNVAVDGRTGRVLVDVQTRQELVTIDPTSLQIVRRAHLDGCDNDHGLLIDADARLAFVACDANNRLLVVDLDTMQVLARFGLGAGPDVLAFDQATGRLYVAAESGTLSVFAVAGRAVRLLGQRHLADNAHTVAVDPTTHRVYFPLQSVGGRPVLRVMQPT